jgi:hypothetical protein
MSQNQIIHTYVDFLDEFIKDNFFLENGGYCYTTEVYKKLQYENKIQPFLKNLIDYYYPSKHHYLTKSPTTFNSFNTILRQVFRRNELNYQKNVKYKRSKYQVEYIIMYENE